MGLWIGEDDYDTTKVCGKVHAQHKSLREIMRLVTGQKLTVLRRTTADDKAMRTSNGTALLPALPIPSLLSSQQGAF